MYASGAASSIALLSIAATCVLASYEPFQSLVARTSTAVAKKFPQLMSGGSPPFLLEICGGIGARCSSSYDLLHMLHAACCMLHASAAPTWRPACVGRWLYSSD